MEVIFQYELPSRKDHVALPLLEIPLGIETARVLRVDFSGNPFVWRFNLQSSYFANGRRGVFLGRFVKSWTSSQATRNNLGDWWFIYKTCEYHYLSHVRRNLDVHLCIHELLPTQCDFTPKIPQNYSCRKTWGINSKPSPKSINWIMAYMVAWG